MLKPKLIEIVGKENVLDSDADKLIYSYDATQIKGKVDYIVLPENIEQVHKLTRAANRYNFVITPRGAGTSLCGNATPDGGIVMDFSKMNHIIDVDVTKKVAYVQPGVILEDLNQYLKRFELFFPIIPSSHEVCTIGGMIANNAAGRKAIKYGKTVDWVYDIEIVDGTGKHYKTKESKKFAGTEGCIALIVGATLKLTDIAETQSMDHFEFKKIEELIDAVKQLQKRDVNSIEFFDPLSAVVAGKAPKYNLFVEYDDNSGKIISKEDWDKLIALRKNVGQQLAVKGYDLTSDPQIPIESLNDFLQWLKAKEIPCLGHIGIGIIHARFSKEQTALVEEMYAKAKELGGIVTGEHGIGTLKKKYLEAEFKEDFMFKKREHDPNNILNRGKIL